MKNSFIKKYVIFLILLFILFVGFILFNNRSKTLQKQNISQGPVTGKTYKTESDNQGSIDVEVTPKVLSTSLNSSFEVGINNHQVDLTYDLSKIAKLTDNKGNKYTPISWNGPEGGHHSNGVLVFPPISKDATSINLLLPKIGGVDRKFSWNL